MANPRLRKVKATPTSPAVEQLIKENAEVLVITVNRSDDGEHDVAIYQKVADTSTLVPYLGEVLKQLVKTNEPKPCGRTQTTVGA